MVKSRDWHQGEEIGQCLLTFNRWCTGNKNKSHLNQEWKCTGWPIYHYTVSKKMCQLWNGIAQNYKDRFWWHLAKILKILQNRVCMPKFLCRFAFFINFSIFKPDTENNANFESYASHCLSTWHHSVKNTKFWSKVCMIVNFKAPGSL